MSKEVKEEVTLKGDFFYYRTTFRAMSKFYKAKFEDSTGNLENKTLSRLSKAWMDERVKKLNLEIFGKKLMNNLSPDHMEDLMSSMYATLFSHRHNKFMKTEKNRIETNKNPNSDKSIMAIPS